MLPTALLFVCFAFPLLATPVLDRRWDALAVKHEWITVPKGWTADRPAPEDYKFNLRIGLKQDRFDELVNHLYEVSDPSHARYGAHLSKEQVEQLVAPHDDTVELVESWLAHHGIEASSCHRSSAGNWLSVPVTIKQAEEMLGADYNVYKHGKTGEEVVRTMSYSIPDALHGHINVISPTTYFSTIKSMRATHRISEVAPIDNDHELQAQVAKPGGLATVPASCNTVVTPSCLRALYNTTAYTPQATDVNVLGVAGYLDEFANFADLQTFFGKFRTDAVGANFTVVQVNGGGNDQTEPGVEANLDIQYTEGMSFPTPNVYFSTGGAPPFTPDDNTPADTNEPYLDFLDFILAQTTVPQTLTTSYGDDEQTVPSDFAQSACNEFAQLGARGVSIMFSSGDDGVGGGDCLTNDGTKLLLVRPCHSFPPSKVLFQPNFPASCPFVTAVGGTIRTNPEVAVDFSAGGFSRLFAQPSYQAAAVSSFLTGLGGTFSGLFNASGRAYPDVAAQGNGFQVVIGGRTGSVGGTSASSPTFAGVVALLNDFRIANGKAPLGFLNPFLYSKGVAGFNDITSGSNPGCGTNGFTAGPGWDPVTGLGTPDFGKLQGLVLDV